jgi:hypothetical protein
MDFKYFSRLSNGNALKIVRKTTIKSMKNNKNAINSWVGVENDEDLNYGSILLKKSIKKYLLQEK